MRKKFPFLYPDDGNAAAAAAAPAAPAVPAIAPAAPAVPDAPTLAGAKPDTAPEAPKPEGYWPADWRTKVAGEDKDLTERLNRFASPADIAKSWVEASKKISDGSLKPVLPKDATPEQLTAYRKSMGLPETPDKYELDLGKDSKLDLKSDGVQAFLKAAHATNQTPEQVKSSLKFIEAIRTSDEQQRAEKDSAFRSEAEETLRAEWGGEYKRNLNVVHGMLDGMMTPELKNSFLNGRMADGSMIADNPAMLKALVSLALINNPTATIVPGAGGNLAKGIEEELASISKFRNENRTAYNKDEKMQARERELIDANELMKSRKAK